MKKANPKAVGGFALGAIALAVAAVIVFGGGAFFSEQIKAVVFFSGSLKGLRVGAPVELRGVHIGAVSDISVQAGGDLRSFALPVVIDIDPSRIKTSDGRLLSAIPAEEKASIAELIEMGLRAQLVPQSLVTGQQSIQLDFLPGTEVSMQESTLPYPEIPTAPSEISALRSSADRLMEQTGETMAELRALLSEENRSRVTAILENGVEASGNLATITSDLQAPIADSKTIVATFKADMPKFQGLVQAGRDTLGSYRSVAERADGMLAENQDGIKQAIDGLRSVADKLARMADTATRLMAENEKGISDFTSTGLYEFTNLAVDSQAAVEQFRRVLEAMERDPARFFLGKPGQVEVR